MLRSGNEGIRPDVISFSTCLDAWATRAASPERPNTPVAAGADCLRPNEVAYDAVLNACAFSAFAPEEERRRALAIAVAAFREIGVLPYVGPDVVTYGMMLKCVANLVPMGEGEARVSMAGDLFGRHCGEGLVGRLVLEEVGGVAALDRLLERKGVQMRKGREWDVKDLPEEFVCNVKEWKGHDKKKGKKKIKGRSKQQCGECGGVHGDGDRPKSGNEETTSWQRGEFIDQELW